MFSDEMLRHFVNQSVQPASDGIAEIAHELLQRRTIERVTDLKTIEAAKLAGVLYCGCDTINLMADEIVYLRERLAMTASVLEGMG